MELFEKLQKETSLQRLPSLQSLQSAKLHEKLQRQMSEPPLLRRQLSEGAPPQSRASRMATSSRTENDRLSYLMSRIRPDKYGQLTTEVVHFIEQGEGVANDAMGALHAEMARRASAVTASKKSLSTLCELLRSPHESIRMIVLNEMSRASASLRPDPALMRGCGHELERDCNQALHRLLGTLTDLLARKRTSEAEARLIVQALRLPFAAPDFHWIEDANLLDVLHTRARRCAEEARLTRFCILRNVIRCSLEARRASTPQWVSVWSRQSYG